MNETRSNPTTDTRCPTLFYRWHGPHEKNPDPWRRRMRDSEIVITDVTWYYLKLHYISGAKQKKMTRKWQVLVYNYKKKEIGKRGTKFCLLLNSCTRDKKGKKKRTKDGQGKTFFFHLTGVHEIRRARIFLSLHKKIGKGKHIFSSI